MPDNPLFPTDQTPSDQNQPSDPNPAADLIRRKVANIYADEPDTKKELAEVELVKPRSKHQQFMYDLSTSGKSLADIQGEWHKYYLGLPDKEKHEVWQEFYDATAQSSGYPYHVTSSPEKKPEETKPAETGKPADSFSVGHFKPTELPSHQRTRAIDRRTASEIRRVIRNKVSSGGKLKAKHHLQSLLFGLGTGCLVIFVFLFGFFNQVIIAPFIQPGRNSADTPIIIDPSGPAPSANPEVIIPKIDVEIPTVYNQTSINEADIENSLEDGVVHYPTTVDPGQDGNAAFFGHSSNNVFTPGEYKYAFVLLHELVNGDTFYLTFNGKIYVYKVISKNIVSPNDVSVLDAVAGQAATATLITCDPPGTSLNRLVVVGQQISPDPATNSQVTLASTETTTQTTTLPSDGPGLWSQVTKSLSGKLIMALVFLAGAAILAWSVRLVIRSL